MSRIENSQSTALLKQISYRLTSTPVPQIPRQVPQIAASLWTCRDLLSTTPASTKSNSETGLAVHRFKTQLITLLQDRTIEGRWSAIVLLKALLEAGGVEVLSKAGPWVKSLLGILKKPDPSTTRTLATITLTRIFMLTWEHANLVREITTPALPTFIATLLSNADNKRCSACELQTILEAFSTLLPRHPTTFRSHETPIRALLTRIISSTASPTAPTHYNASHVSTAQKLIVQLHHCAPKQGMAEKWDPAFKSTVTAAHTTADRVFRSVIEDWRSTASVLPSISAQTLLAGELEVEGEDAAGLGGWKGVHAGVERLASLIDLSASHLDTATAGTVSVRIGLVTDLITRLLSVTVPVAGRADFVKPNQQVSRDEREALYSLLPGLHATTLRLIQSLMERFGKTLLSVVPTLLSQATWAFRAEKNSEVLRAAAYDLLATTLPLIGATMSKDEAADLGPYILACCNDLLPPAPSTTTPSTPSAPSGSSTSPQHPTRTLQHERAANALLPLLLAHLPSSSLPRKLRAQIDRTAVLTRHKPALLASVLNPTLKPTADAFESSLLPLLARLYPGESEVEALVRPRMPITVTGGPRTATAAGEGEDEDEESEDDDMDEEPQLEAAEEGEQDGEDGTGDVDAMNTSLATNLNEKESARTAAEPDLLSALDEHLGTTGPMLPATPVPATPSAQLRRDMGIETPAPRFAAAKRTAVSAPEPGVPAKRVRAEAAAETLAPGTGANLPGPAPAIGSAGVPGTVVGGGQSAVVAGSAGQEAEDGREDSDFEMPPLTMEPDTDDEDEEDE